MSAAAAVASSWHVVCAIPVQILRGNRACSAVRLAIVVRLADCELPTGTWADHLSVVIGTLP
jgi:hypothetical protein